MLFNYVLTLIMYARGLIRYEINYFVLSFVHMHVLIQSNAHVENSKISFIFSRIYKPMASIRPGCKQYIKCRYIHIYTKQKKS